MPYDNDRLAGSDAPQIVMTGLVPAIHVFLGDVNEVVDARDERGHDGLNERVVEIIPLRICGMNESHLPGSRPMLDRLFALNGISNIVKALCINQSLQAVVSCKSVNKAVPMFVGSPRQVTCDADVQDAVAPIGHEINPAAHR